MIPDFREKRVAILGVGNEMLGDDAAGVLAVRLLRKRLIQKGFCFLQNPVRDQAEYQVNTIFLIEAGLAPENFSGSLRLFNPDIILLIDAVQSDLPAGSYAWFELGQVSGFSGSTHLLPLSIFSRFLMDEIQCKVFLIGIQPASLVFDVPISPKVRKAVRLLTTELAQNLWKK